MLLVLSVFVFICSLENLHLQNNCFSGLVVTKRRGDESYHLQLHQHHGIKKTKKASYAAEKTKSKTQTTIMKHLQYMY